MDGARQVKRKGEDDIPDWPQPQENYGKGMHFYPIEFPKTPRDTYERDGERSADLPVEYEAPVTGDPEEDVHQRGRQRALKVV